MLVLWRQIDDPADENEPVNDVAALDALLDRLHKRARAEDYPHAVHLYAGQRYPHPAHGRGNQWIPEDPGDGPQPELMLVVGAEDSPVSWFDPAGHEHTSVGPRHVHQPEPRYFFEFYFGGQESYATESSLVPSDQAREAARQFLASGGQRPANITWRTPQPA